VEVAWPLRYITSCEREVFDDALMGREDMLYDEYDDANIM